MDRHELNATIAPLMQVINDQSSRIDKLEKAMSTSQLNNASLTSKITVYDDDGETALYTIGKQDDGSAGTVAIDGPVPTKPSQPIVTAGPLSLTVAWDGETWNGDVLTVDFSHVEIHLSTDEDFTPSAGTLVGTLLRSDQVVVSPLEPVEHYVVFVSVSAPGKRSEATTSVRATPDPAVAPNSITETDIQDDSISTPKLQANSVIGDKIAANTIEAGNIAAGAITAEKLAAILVLATRLVAGDPNASRVEIQGDGILAYDVDGNPTLSISAEDGSIAMLGTLTTDVDGKSWSIGANGISTSPGENTSPGPSGNPSAQIAWQEDGQIKALIEARADGRLYINNYDNLTLMKGPGVWITSDSATDGNLVVDGLINGRIPAHRRIAAYSGSTWAANNQTFTVVLPMSMDADTGDIPWDVTNGAFTIPYTGIYELTGGIAWHNNNGPSTGQRMCDIYNSTQSKILVSSTRTNATGTYCETNVNSGPVKLTAGDKIQLRGYQTSSFSLGYRNNSSASGTMPPAFFGIRFIGWADPPTPVNSFTSYVAPVETDSYQGAPSSLWRAGDDVYQGNTGGNGNHRGFFFYGAGAFDFLDGMEIDQVVMYVRRSSSEGSSGAIQPHLRGHPFATNPQPAVPNIPGAPNYPDYGLIGSTGFKPGQYYNVILPNEVGEDLRDGISAGIMFESTSGSGYSRWTGHSTTADGTLTITYHDPNA